MPQTPFELGTFAFDDITFQGKAAPFGTFGQPEAI